MIKDHVIRVPDNAGGAPHWLYIEVKVETFEEGALLDGRLSLFAHYLHGPARKDSSRALVASMGGSIDSHEPYRSHCKITAGTMELGRPLRGHGIGTYLQNLTVGWVKSFGRNFSVDRILLAEIHAETQKDADRRNRFYEQFGVRFLWSTPTGTVDRATGRSDPALMSDELHVLLPGANPLLDKIKTETLQETLVRMGAELTKNAKNRAELDRQLKHVMALNRDVSQERNKFRKRMAGLGAVVALAIAIYLLHSTGVVGQRVDMQGDVNGESAYLKRFDS